MSRAIEPGDLRVTGHLDDTIAAGALEVARTRRCRAPACSEGWRIIALRFERDPVPAS